jgi:hypothetical protein
LYTGIRLRNGRAVAFDDTTAYALTETGTDLLRLDLATEQALAPVPLQFFEGGANGLAAAGGFAMVLGDGEGAESDRGRKLEVFEAATGRFVGRLYLPTDVSTYAYDPALDGLEGAGGLWCELATP